EAAVGANTAAKIPDHAGLEQHVEGVKRDQAADKAGTVARGAADAADAAEADAAPRQKVVDINRGARPASEPAAADMPPAPAGPAMRRRARELGVDINTVQGTGPNGRISMDDVKAHAKRLVTSAGAGRGAGAAEALPDFSRWGEIDRQPMRPVRRKTAE